jgi:RNA polymerase sigma-70 factor (ECF subfamily)
MVERSRHSSADAANDAMELYADGEDAAFARVYDALEPRLRRFAFALTGSDAAANDVIQQTLLQIHLSRARFARGAPVVPWAYAIARNFIRDTHRRALTEQKLAPEPSAPPVPMPDEALEQKRRSNVVGEEIWRLPEQLREAFLLVNVEELPVVEVAEILGISPGNVKVRAHRARKLLAEAAALRLRGV